MSSANIREHSHLAEYPGSTLVIIEISEVRETAPLKRLQISMPSILLFQTQISVLWTRFSLRCHMIYS